MYRLILGINYIYIICYNFTIVILLFSCFIIYKKKDRLVNRDHSFTLQKLAVLWDIFIQMISYIGLVFSTDI